MRVISILFVLSFVIGALVRGVCAQQAKIYGPGSRVALVIGNAGYPNADHSLTQPVGNASAVGEELKRDGFQVEEGTNLTKEAMQRAFGRLYDRIKPGTVVVIFFSGFGIQSNNKSYMIPVDAQIYKEDDVHHDGISVDKVLSDMDKRGAGVKIIILDASRRNRYEGNFRAAPLGLALPANPPSGTLVMYSAGSGMVVRDSASERSLFVGELLNEMRAPGVSAEEVFKSTRAGVLQASQSEQNPSYFSSLNEDFSFGQPFAPSKPEPHVAQSYPPDGEQRDREVAQPAGANKGEEDFLKKNPASPSGGGAGEHLSALAIPPGAGETPPPLPGEQAHARVKDGEAIKDLDTYIINHPGDAASIAQRGQLYAKINDFPRAIRDFDKSLRLQPNDAEALNNRCWSFAMVGELRPALKDCNEALHIRPNYADALDSRGFVRLKLGKPSRAIADYDAALRIKRQASSFYGRGLAKKQTGDSAGADSDIAEAKAIDPSIGAEFERSGLR
jgi:tetratricopeptide (TPR) repeat protein